MNVLEQIAREWFDSQDFFTKTNVKFGKLAGGGYAGEIDVLGYNAKKKEAVHVETSFSATSNQLRESKLSKKFDTAEAHYSKLLPGDCKKIRRIAVLGWTTRPFPLKIRKDIEIFTIPMFMEMISKELSSPEKKVWQGGTVPEIYPLMRAIQLAIQSHQKMGEEPKIVRERLTLGIIRKKYRKQIFQIAEKYRAGNIRIFGSTARSENSSESDIDFLVDFEKGQSLLDHAGLIGDLEDLLGRHVDVVTAKGLKPRFRDQVLKEAIPL